jgi:hypothetical protein
MVMSVAFGMISRGDEWTVSFAWPRRDVTRLDPWESRRANPEKIA